MKKTSTQIGLGIALGAGLGAAVALVIGSGGLWLALGVALGIVFGASMWRRKSEYDEVIRNKKLTADS
jgi:uncharacterized membrane protein YfcA